MPRIRLLTSVAGDGPVAGDVGDVLEVDSKTARIWADGERAERVIEREPAVEQATPRPANRSSGSEKRA